MTIEQIASAVYNNTVTGLAGITSNPKISIEQLQDEVVAERNQPDAARHGRLPGLPRNPARFRCSDHHALGKGRGVRQSPQPGTRRG